MNRFQVISCLVSKESHFYREKYQFFQKCLYRSVSNEQISSDFLLGFKGATFGEKYQFFQSNAIPVQCQMNRFQGISCNKFQEIAFYRLVSLHTKLYILIK